MLGQSFVICLLAVSIDIIQSLSIEDLIPFNEDQITLKKEDDAHSDEINLNPKFLYFGKKYDKLFVNNNGDITFNKEFETYVNKVFPIKDKKVPIIAPFWADVNTEHEGRVVYRQTSDPDVLQNVTDIIRCSSILYKDFTASWTFIATWEDVGFYGANTEGRKRKNTFQAVLARDSSANNSFVIMNYAKLEWIAASSNGGNKSTGLRPRSVSKFEPAQAGFDAGDEVNFYSIPGSRTERVLDLPNTTNCEFPGRWIFKISEAIQSGK